MFGCMMDLLWSLMVCCSAASCGLVILDTFCFPSSSPNSCSLEPHSRAGFGLTLARARWDYADCTPWPDPQVGVEKTHLAFAQAWAVRQGWVAPEVEQMFKRARELSQQMADNPQLYPMLGGLTAFYMFCGQLHTALGDGATILHPVQRADDPGLYSYMSTPLLGELLDSFREFSAARTDLRAGR